MTVDVKLDWMLIKSFRENEKNLRSHHLQDGYVRDIRGIDVVDDLNHQ